MSFFGISIRNGVSIGLRSIVSFGRQASAPSPPAEPPQAVFSEATNSQYVPLFF